MVDAQQAVHELRELEQELRQRGDAVSADTVRRALAALSPENELITTGEAAALLGIRSVNTIKRWARMGLLQGFRRGGRVFVSRQSVQGMLEQPELAKEKEFEDRLEQVLAESDAGDEELPSDGVSRRKRNPWDHSVAAGV